MPTVDHRQRVRRRVRVYGRVQGVYFRATLVEQARMLGVDGWVRNIADGSVEAVLEGSADHVDQLIAWCRTGPSAARVDEVRVEHEPERGIRGFAWE